MAYILHIETSTKNCSVSLGKNGELIGLKEINTGGYSHAEMLHPLIVDLMNEAGVSIQNIDAVSVSKGPGSYTGLRIGVSAAKGICFSNDIPLISLESLAVLAQSAKVSENEVIIPLLDARRMEVYASVFDHQNQKIRDTQAEIIDKDSFKEFLSYNKIVLVGDGAEKCKEVLTSEKFEFVLGEFPSAKHMTELSYNKFLKSDFEDVAYFEPYYLKDFIATPEKKK